MKTVREKQAAAGAAASPQSTQRQPSASNA
jgi:hypothetical protein